MERFVRGRKSAAVAQKYGTYSIRSYGEKRGLMKKSVNVSLGPSERVERQRTGLRDLGIGSRRGDKNTKLVLQLTLILQNNHD